MPCEYDLLGEFSEGAIMLMKDHKYGFADTSGIIIVPVENDYNGIPLIFKNGYAAVEKNKKQNYRE